MKIRLVHAGLAAVVTLLPAAPLLAQRPSNSRYADGSRMPLSPRPPSGEPVAPFFEGWYKNDDGTFTLSFGYFNLNTEEELDLPLGPENFIEPAEFDGAQPTYFTARPRRNQGVFHVTVPAAYADEESRVVWTVTANGVTHSVPGRVGFEALQLDYEPRAMGSVPPIARFLPEGNEGQHIQGVWAEPRSTTVGEPVPLVLAVREVSERYPDDVVNRDVEVEVTWFKYQGPPGEVVFDPDSSLVVEHGDGEVRSTATFMAPGDYVLRARVDNFDANDSSARDQCCWTNAYVRVSVSR